MAPLTIEDLHPENEAQTIKLRVGRMWDCIQTISEIRNGTAFVGIDYRGNGIHVHIFEHYAGLFRHRLNEGGIYTISNFTVVPPHIPDIATQTPYIILFHEDTIIHEDSDPRGIFNRYFFDFSGENSLLDDNKWEIHLTDIIGIIKSISRTTYLIMPHGNTVEKKTIEIMTLRGRILNLILAEPTYRNLNFTELIQRRPRPAVIFTGIKVRNYFAGMFLNSTSATKIYVDLDIPETYQVHEMYRKMDEANGTPNNHD